MKWKINATAHFVTEKTFCKWVIPGGNFETCSNLSPIFCTRWKHVFSCLESRKLTWPSWWTEYDRSESMKLLRATSSKTVQLMMFFCSHSWNHHETIVKWDRERQEDRRRRKEKKRRRKGREIEERQMEIYDTVNLRKQLLLTEIG